MTSVITGDIINSRKTNNPEKWLAVLKEAFNSLAPSKKYWEIYRGDSFQIEIGNISNSFLAAILIKSTIKSIKELDVRMAIGIGDKTHEGQTILESNGSAFVNSGIQFEQLKQQKVNLAVLTPNDIINEELNLYFKLASIAMDNWTKSSAEIVKVSIQNPNLSQEELGNLIGIKQSAVSERIKRAALDEILELDTMYQKKIKTLQNT
ncbi:transcriptional regulator [Galbibacter sp. BG1]|uniref:SatD family protein n=1 Tax=Galbibacter sp. BG1 TaxID=1170699 RepID=UPI0015BB602A|nr:SatD family protein [Galbibacter sp. BG1]QLE02243.1 transcriptional regulator [Galbibacter sp. BG1]